MEAEIEKVKEEIRRNFDFFSKQQFDQNEFGKFAILKDRKIIYIMDTVQDARKMADEKYTDGIYSIQQIHPPEKDLGFVSYALRAVGTSHFNFPPLKSPEGICTFCV